MLIRRLKSHFLSLPCGVDLILGLNGYIWVSKHVGQSQREGEEGFDAEAVYSNHNDVCMGPRGGRSFIDRHMQDIDDATRAAISRVSNLIRTLAAYWVPLTDNLLLEAYEWAIEQEISIPELLQPEVAEALIDAVSIRR